MSEFLPWPDTSRFPALDLDPAWVRELPAGSHIARIFRAGGTHPTRWHEFREYGPLDGRYDPHPLPTGPSPGIGVLYGVLEYGVVSSPTEATTFASGPFAAALLEVFQGHRMIRLSAGLPTLVDFAISRPIRLLDVSDSDWVTSAGGNAAISSGDRAVSRAWTRAMYDCYPEIDGVIAASSVIPTARIVALWSRASDAVPTHPTSLLRLDRPELLGVIDAIADRYGYTLL